MPRFQPFGPFVHVVQPAASSSAYWASSSSHRRGRDVLLEVGEGLRPRDREHRPGSGAAARRARAGPGVAPNRSAAPSRTPPGRASSPVATGNHGMNTMSLASAYVRTSSDCRLARLYRFWTLAISATARAASSWATLTSETPMCAILPSFCSVASSPIDSSSGTCGSTRWSWNRSRHSVPEAAQAQLGLLAQILRAAQRVPLARPGPHEAGLGGDHDAVVRVQRLADQFLADVGAVRVGGVEEVDAEVGGPAQDGHRLRTARRVTPDALAGDLHRAVAEAVDLQVSAEADPTGGRGGGLVGGRCRGVGGGQGGNLRLGMRRGRQPACGQAHSGGHATAAATWMVAAAGSVCGGSSGRRCQAGGWSKEQT